jgi:hypothetical protein
MGMGFLPQVCQSVDACGSRIKANGESRMVSSGTTSSNAIADRRVVTEKHGLASSVVGWSAGEGRAAALRRVGPARCRPLDRGRRTAESDDWPSSSRTDRLAVRGGDRRRSYRGAHGIVRRRHPGGLHRTRGARRRRCLGQARTAALAARHRAGHPGAGAPARRHANDRRDHRQRRRWYGKGCCVRDQPGRQAGHRLRGRRLLAARRQGLCADETPVGRSSRVRRGTAERG